MIFHLKKSNSQQKSFSEAIRDFLLEGLAQNEGLLVIASFEQINAIKSLLEMSNIDLDSVLKREQIIFWNSSRTLTKFMKEGLLESSKVREVFELTLRKLKSRFTKIRFYGEMVQTLWQRRNLTGAIELEKVLQNLSVEFEIQTLRPDPFGDPKNLEFLLSLLQGHTKVSGLAQKVKMLEKQNQELKQQLKISQDTLQTNNQSRYQFLSALSFEIRSPLSTILGFSELMMDSEISMEERESYFQKVFQNAKQLAQVTDEMLSFSTIEPSLEIQRTQFSFVEFIQKILLEMNNEVEAKGLQFIPHCEGRFPETVESDPKILRQILMQLVRNAVRMTELGSVDVSIRCVRNMNLEACRIEIYIRDTGAGFRHEELASLFKPSQNRNETETSHQALGLFFTRLQARSLDGDVQLIGTNPGVGSLFKFTMNI